MKLNLKHNMNLRHTVLTCAIACVLTASPVASATDHAHVGASKSEAAGVGAGAIIGGVVGGPVGAILGAAIGGHYGDTRHQAKTNKSLVRDSVNDLKASRDKLQEALTDQNRLDMELLEAQDELDALNQKMEQLFVERTLVDGLQFDVHFDTDEAALGNADQTRLVSLSELLKAVPEAEVALHGFADSRGKLEYNEALSLDRAYTVADTLSALGVAQSQIKTYALGESQSTYSGKDVDPYSHDRRVSIRLRLPTEEPLENTAESAALPKVAKTGSGQ